MNRRRQVSGFTLLELITALSIVAILAAIAVPSFSHVTTSNRVSSEVNALLGDMQYARVEAIKEGNPVAVCVADATGKTCSGSMNWDTGWIVFSNPLGDGALPSGQLPLRFHPSLSSSGSTDTIVATETVLVFNREGFAPGLTDNPTWFTVHNTPYDASFTRCVQLLPTGYLATATSGGGCI